MGVTTRYLGHVEIGPPLNQAEYDYLRLFAASRRSLRNDGPYAVFPRDPHEEAPTLHGEAAAERYNRIADGQPGYWCQWVPCPRGCCLSWNGREKFYAGGAWLQYLIDHFLRPGALAQADGGVWFRRFTFDHDVNGVVVGEQGDNRELFSLTVEHGEVTRTTLRRGDRCPGTRVTWRRTSCRGWGTRRASPSSSGASRRRSLLCRSSRLPRAQGNEAGRGGADA